MGRPKFKPEKIFKKNNLRWWSSLTPDQQRAYKFHYEKVREWNSTQTNPYPNMYDTTDVRVSKLSDKQIHRIWCFKDHPEDRPRYS